MECLKDYEILLGTYEAFVLGYKLSEDRKPKLETSIADHAHAGSIRCITGKSLSEALIFASNNPQYDNRFQAQTWGEHIVYRNCF